MYEGWKMGGGIMWKLTKAVKGGKGEGDQNEKAKEKWKEYGKVER
jgi:hypothetical protein